MDNDKRFWVQWTATGQGLYGEDITQEIWVMAPTRQRAIDKVKRNLTHAWGFKEADLRLKITDIEVL